ncbi:MAG: polyphosphate kinase 2 family protein [Ilumatobacter sp.]|nr:polyphosphate kinase 2 family protein [Ilumatobacter sp.]
MIDITELRDELRARPSDGAVNLAGYPTDATPFVDSESDAVDELEDDLHDALFDRHELLFAEEERSVLLVLQGLDASGKNGTIKHVVIAMNPAGVRVASFAEPTEEEQQHEFLWRYRNELPAPGQLGVFNRSHYEDLIVPSVTGELSDNEIAERIDAVNAFESELAADGTTIIKCLLHISFDEQRERFLRRLRRDDKRWKFSVSDLETRRQWDEFQAAYGEVVGATTSEHAPWYVIPADKKWYRNWAIAQLIIGTIDAMAPAYPQPDLDIDALRDALAAPN